MSVQQADIVDLVSQANNGDCVLTVSDHLEWDHEGSHLLVLQDKVNRYLAFIESGELVERFPKYKGVAITIQICFKYRPDVSGARFLELAGDAVRGAGFGFEYKVLSVNAGTEV